jgi:hypothetical protein
MLWPKARGPRWFGDQLWSRSSSLSWRRPRPRSWWWRERLSRLLSTLSARRRASMVLRVSRLGPRRLLTVDVAAPTPSPRSQCWEGGRFGPRADGAPACLRSERWREAELSACCVAAASSSAFSCWRICRSSEVAGSEVLRRPPEEWQGVSVSVGVDVRTSVGTSVAVGRRPVCRRCRRAVVRLIGRSPHGPPAQERPAPGVTTCPGMYRTIA